MKFKIGRNKKHKEGLSTDLETAKEIEQKLEEHRNSKN
ncbi:hypothetical protein FORMB_23140 [Formosa sp. Hel1_33_131]|nr:hypothetical protein FORMB_23140 [Formosa sp. Hel1_33_131]